MEFPSVRCGQSAHCPHLSASILTTPQVHIEGVPQVRRLRTHCTSDNFKATRTAEEFPSRESGAEWLGPADSGFNPVTGRA